MTLSERLRELPVAKNQRKHVLRLADEVKQLEEENERWMMKLSEQMQQILQMPDGPPITGIEAWWTDKLIVFTNEVKQLEQENETLRQYIYHSGSFVACRCCIDSLGYDPQIDPETTFPSEPE